MQLFKGNTSRSLVNDAYNKFVRNFRTYTFFVNFRRGAMLFSHTTNNNKLVSFQNGNTWHSLINQFTI